MGQTNIGVFAQIFVGGDKGTGLSPSAEGREACGEQDTSHLDEDQRKLLATLKSVVEKRARVKGAAVKGRTAKTKPLPLQLHCTPTPTQLARWYAVQKARIQWMSLRIILSELGMSRVAPENMPWTKFPSPNCSAPRNGPRPQP